VKRKFNGPPPGLGAPIAAAGRELGAFDWLAAARGPQQLTGSPRQFAGSAWAHLPIVTPPTGGYARIVYRQSSSRRPEPERVPFELNRKRNNGETRPRKRILLVDRHALMRRAAAGWINRCPGLEVCGIASGPAQAFLAVEQLHPDVVVSEIMRTHGLGFIRELHRRQPRLPILVFSIHDEELYGSQARQAGASAYLMKAVGGHNLVQRICSVLRRRRNRAAGEPKGAS
jgi:CheY-like chemotaxis protein